MSVKPITIAAKLMHLGEGELLGMIPPDTFARLKRADGAPEFRAYGIAHEGEAAGTIVGLGKRIVQYFRDAVIKLHDKLTIGTKIFHRHGASNEHAGRQTIGEIVGKRLATIGGTLYNIAAVYVEPPFRGLPLDIASIEAEVQLTEGDDGSMTAVEIGDITGVALSSSSVERPGFPGATLLATIQAFVDEGKGEVMTLEEIKAAVVAGKFNPSQLFEASVLTADPVVVAHVKTEKQTEFEHARRVENKLAEERADFQKKIKEHEDQVTTLRAESIKGQAKDVFGALATERKLSDQEKAYLLRELGKFQTEAKDADALKVDANKFIDAQLTAYNDLAALFGVKKAPEKKAGVEGAPSGDGGSENPDDLTDPANNDFIPA